MCAAYLQERRFWGEVVENFSQGGRVFFVEDLLMLFSIVGEVLGVAGEGVSTVLVVLDEGSNLV